MSFVLLHGGAAGSLVADDPVLPAREVAPLRDALAIMARADTLHGDIEQLRDATNEQAQAAGYAAGHAEGLKAASAEVGAELFRLSMRDGDASAARDREVATLALAVVRRIAGELGDDAMVAALAAKAASAVAPDTRTVVRIAPDALPAVSARLAAMPNVQVEADAKLDANDCVVETALGSAHAGLETQLAQIERAWADRRAAG